MKKKVKVKKIIKESKVKTKAKTKTKKKSKPKTRLTTKTKGKTKAKTKVKTNTASLKRSKENPILGPGYYDWDNVAVFNPAAIYAGGKVHLLYRAMGTDGVSRIGYAESKDGVHFNNHLTYPVYSTKMHTPIDLHSPFTSPARKEFNPSVYTSGGGWGGSEDPRAVVIDDEAYMTLNIFNGWHSMRVGVVSISLKDLLAKKWNWHNFAFLSREGDRQKNWVLFPEKIKGKFAIFHNLDMGDSSRVGIAFLDYLDASLAPTSKEAPDPQVLPDHYVAWHKRTRSIASPPVRTTAGWLVLYHAMDGDGSPHYKLGAMLLSLSDPTKVIARAPSPILEPKEWYEHDYKPGIIYACGAVVIKNILHVYYGAGDKHIALATIPITELVESMKKNQPISLRKRKISLQ